MIKTKTVRWRSTGKYAIITTIMKKCTFVCMLSSLYVSFYFIVCVGDFLTKNIKISNTNKIKWGKNVWNKKNS